MDRDRLKTLLTRIEAGRDDMPNDEKHWLLNEGLAEWFFPPATAMYGGQRTYFSGKPSPPPTLCLTSKGTQKLKDLSP